MATKSFTELRRSAGLDQTSAAKLLGVSRTTIMRWETGRANPALSIEQCKTLCREFHVSVEEWPDSFENPNRRRRDESCVGV